MSFNGSGTFVINSAGQPVVTGTVISSTMFNALTADLATGLSTCLTKDGQTAATQRIPFAAGLSLSNGTVAAPALNFINDTGCGLYRIGSASIGFAISGARILDLSASGLGIGVAAGLTGAVLFRGTTSGVVTLSVADAAGTWTLKLPSAAGTSGYFLQTDGAGITSWAAGGTLTWTNETASFNAASNNGYYIAANSVVATLPVAPANGDYVVLAENLGSSGATGCSVARNGKTIMGLAANMTLDTIHFWLRLTYYSASGDWRLT